MTTVNYGTQTCAVCGANVKCALLASTNTRGNSDLDFRPAEMYRSTMHMWLQECPKCNYINDDIEHLTDNANVIVASSKYLEIYTDISVPKLARKFSCYALLNTYDNQAAGIALIHAAWACDDSNETMLAVTYRSQAADLLLSLQPFEDDEESVNLATTLVDVLRRAQRFSESVELVTKLRTLESVALNDIIDPVLEYQAWLCGERNIGCHNILRKTIPEKLIIVRAERSMITCPKIPANHPRIIYQNSDIPNMEGRDFVHEMPPRWRGYQGTWQIFGGRLHLIRLSGCYQRRDDESFIADWVTGVLRIEQGKRNLRPGPYKTEFSQELRLTIERGIVKKTRVFNKYFQSSMKHLDSDIPSYLLRSE